MPSPARLQQRKHHFRLSVFGGHSASHVLLCLSLNVIVLDNLWLVTFCTLISLPRTLISIAGSFMFWGDFLLGHQVRHAALVSWELLTMPSYWKPASAGSCFGWMSAQVPSVLLDPCASRLCWGTPDQPSWLFVTSGNTMQEIFAKTCGYLYTKWMSRLKTIMRHGSHFDWEKKETSLSHFCPCLFPSPLLVVSF